MIYTDENWKPPVTYCEPNKVKVQKMNRQEAIDILAGLYRVPVEKGSDEFALEINKAIDMAIESLQDDWIPFTFRPPTEEEKEMHPDWNEICDSKIPEDGQEVLISYKGDVSADVFCDDDGICLENWGAIEESMAWKPLPAPYKESDTE